jgi:hypothetical protein
MVMPSLHMPLASFIKYGYTEPHCFPAYFGSREALEGRVVVNLFRVLNKGMHSEIATLCGKTVQKDLLEQAEIRLPVANTTELIVKFQSFRMAPSSLAKRIQAF